MENGRIPESARRPIAGLGTLMPPAAAAWNAMAAHIYEETGVRIAPNGPISSYRTFEQQEDMRAYWCGRGACENAAVPGTSNHGWALAVDTDDSELVNRYGAPFGFQKGWSDAPQEPWHFKYVDGHYSGDDPGPDYLDSKPKPRWFKRLGNRIDAARKRRQSKKQRRKHGDPTATRRAQLHRQIQKLGDAISRWMKRRKRWLEKNR